jgi:hypothetical protein
MRQDDDPRWLDLPEIAAAVRRRMEDPHAAVRRIARDLYAKGAQWRMALRWLASRQDGDGGWAAASLPVAPDYAPDRVGTTALVLSAFLGAGYDHQTPNRYRRKVRAAIEHLLCDQRSDGRFADDERDHALATQQICEAYAMTADPLLKDPCESALAAIAAPQPGDAASRCGLVRLSLQISALRSGRSGNLAVPALAAFSAIVPAAWPVAAADPPWVAEDAAAGSPDGAAFAAMLLLCAGERVGAPRFDRTLELLDRDQAQRIAWSALTAESATFAVFVGGPAGMSLRWAADRQALLDAIRLGDPPLDGSWDAAGVEGDRIALTAARMCLLEFYYRH